MSIWRSPSSRNWSIWFCNLWGQFLSDYTILYIFGKLWRFQSFGSCFAQFQCVLTDLWAFQGCPSFKHSFQDTKSGFEIYEASSYSITLFHTFMESHDDYASFHGSVAQFQHVLAEIRVIETCLSSRQSFQDINLIQQCLRLVLIQLPCSTHCWKFILIVLLLVMVLPNSSLYWHRYAHLKVA